MSTLVTTALRHNASASNNMVLDSSGRVGIGTATPTTQLTIQGTGSSLEINQNVSSIRFSSTPNRTNNWYVGANISDSINGGIIIGSGNDISSGTARLLIDSSGRVTRPSQPYFLASAGFGNTSRFISGNGEFIGNVMTVHFNVGGHYNNATGRFTAPITGRYLISFQYSAETGNIGDISVFRNGSSGFINSVVVVRPTTFSWTNGTQCYVAELNANDFISLGVTAYTNNAGASFCMFSAMLIG